jgi:hypothetical protein
MSSLTLGGALLLVARTTQGLKRWIIGPASTLHRKQEAALPRSLAVLPTVAVDVIQFEFEDIVGAIATVGARPIAVDQECLATESHSVLARTGVVLLWVGLLIGQRPFEGRFKIAPYPTWLSSKARPLPRALVLTHSVRVGLGPRASPLDELLGVVAIPLSVSLASTLHAVTALVDTDYSQIVFALAVCLHEGGW